MTKIASIFFFSDCVVCLFNAPDYSAYPVTRCHKSLTIPGSDLLIEVTEPPGKHRKPKLKTVFRRPDWKVQESLQNFPGGNCFRC